MSDMAGNVGGILGVYVTAAVSLKAMDMVNRSCQNQTRPRTRRHSSSTRTSRTRRPAAARIRRR